MIDTLRGDDDAGVRLHAVNVAARHHEDQEMTDALAWVSEHDPDERVRERALQAFESRTGRPN